jgi:cardiolipin synthase
MSPHLPGSEQQAADPAKSQEPYISNRLLTIPNVICVVRLVGSFVLVAIAWLDLQQLFLWFFLFLAMTDWIDGKLAILLNQRSVFGARLDSWADAALYTALLIGSILMFGATLQAELLWFIPPLATYLLSTVAGFWKYGRWPSYHTRAAKTCWFLIMLGAIGLLTDWSLWPLRIALAATALSNIEALFITLISPVWRADVTSIYHAWRDRS